MENEFIYDPETEFYLPEFYTKFKDQLPILTIVISGHYGPTQWDDFYDGMIVRFHQIHEVKRVIARESSELSRLREEFLSIPVNSKHRFHRVLGKDLFGPEETMEDILKHGLPRLVRFSKYTIPSCMAGRNNDLLAFSEYTQTFLQANTFHEGTLQPGAIACYLSPHISVTPITGIRGKSNAEFKEYIDSLHESVLESTTFRHTDCDLNVRRFNINDDGYKGLISSEIEMNSTFEPELPPRRPKVQSQKGTHCYEEVRNTGKMEISDPDDKNSYTKLQPICCTKKETEQTLISDKRKSSRRNDKELFDVSFFKKKSCQSDSVILNHGAKRELIKGNFHCNKEERSDTEEKTLNTSIEHLSVENVSEILEQLNLGQYVKTFVHQSVDGRLLQNLDNEILMAEFGFKSIEAKRLMLFVMTGHIAKMQ